MNATQTSSDATRMTDLDVLNQLLRGEISALETYASAMKKFTDEPSVTELGRLHAEHQQSVAMLREHVSQLGGQPASGSGWWGTFTTSLIGTGKLLGPQTVLATLKQGEEHGIGEYTRALANEKVAAEDKTALTSALAKCHTHVSALEAMIAKVEAE